MHSCASPWGHLFPAPARIKDPHRPPTVLSGQAQEKAVHRLTQINADWEGLTLVRVPPGSPLVTRNSLARNSSLSPPPPASWFSPSQNTSQWIHECFAAEWFFQSARESIVPGVFEHRVVFMSGHNDAAESVYQINFQMFPVSRNSTVKDPAK